MNIHTLKLPFAESSKIRLTITTLTHTHMALHPCISFIQKFSHIAEVGQRLCFSLAWLWRRWHTPWLKPGPTPLSSRLCCKYFPSQNENHQTPCSARAQTAKKDRNVKPRNVHKSVRKQQKRRKESEVFEPQNSGDDFTASQ